MPVVFSLMLHSHIPYCRKSGVWPAGEEWLFEAMNETYIPLLMVLRQFKLDNIRPRLTIGIVPVLAEQLADGYMNHRFLRQMARELLLLQGSDWPFLLFTAQAKEYANQRLHHHHERFLKLLWAAKDLADLPRLKDTELQSMEDVDSLWVDIDYQLFRPRS